MGDRFATLELDQFRYRLTLMVAAAVSVVFLDLASKAVVVEIEPQQLLFNVSDRAPFGFSAGLVFIVLCSILACVLPVRLVAVGAGLALGGSLANLFSRHWWNELGGTPDFIRFSDGSIGNLADLSIGAGAVAMLLSIIAWVGWTVVAAARASD